MGNLIKCKLQLIKAEFNNNKKKNRLDLIKGFSIHHSCYLYSHSFDNLCFYRQNYKWHHLYYIYLNIYLLNSLTYLPWYTSIYAFMCFNKSLHLIPYRLYVCMNSVTAPSHSVMLLCIIMYCRIVTLTPPLLLLPVEMGFFPVFI